jgi:hypothetical protein
MNSDLFTVAEVAEKIAAGKKLLLAGDARLLAELPAGDWIGGSTTYFMANRSCLSTTFKIFVTELPAYVALIQIKTYSA